MVSNFGNDDNKDIQHNEILTVAWWQGDSWELVTEMLLSFLYF